MSENEEWRVCVQVPAYMVSSIGRVMTVKTGKIRKQYFQEYYRIGLQRGGRQRPFTVHPLICTAWHGPRPSPKHVARHLDDNPHNNTAANIDWGTPAQNAQDKTGRPYNKSRPRGWHEEVRRLVYLFDIPKQTVSRMYDTSKRHIQLICKTGLYHDLGQSI